ncbi:Colicin I receptor precursor [Pigmentiphaga humi]|uniref:Colicin I receptor n=1 Tax=Pigmentiphaga humi TaxID=2478468 RepID=A0A3P4B865_9BURK|nr:TonB-dependent receptor [Pigmentiphaga humi]VCU72464.1 Colicin I receptor precursor [Pigmentiphaga humi]
MPEIANMFRPTPVCQAVLALCAALAAPALHAQAATPEAQRLAPVVVTAGGYEQDIKEAPASISIITREELAKQPFNSVQDAVRYLEGVSVVGASANKQDISIRGMPGKYTLILVDGKRQGTREMLNREELGMVQASQIPPLSAIERIEVVRGPMSSLYGSDAIGGVINIITRKVPDAWHGSLDLDATLQQHSDLGNSRGAGFYLAGPIKDEMLGLQIYGKSSDRSEAQVVDGAYRTRDQSLTAKLSLKPTANQDIEFEAGQQSFKRSGTAGKTVAAGGAPLDLETERTHVALSHTGRWDFGTSNLSLYQEVGKADNTASGVATTSYPNTKLTNTVLDGKLAMPFSRQMVTLGGQFMQSRLEGTNKEAADASGGLNTVSELKSTSWALFGEDEFSVTDKLTLTGGLRLDHHSSYGAHWSPRGYAIYKLSDTLTLRGGVARSFRAPELRQISADYIQATGGATGAPRGTIAGNPDLKPETSTNTELGIRYDAPSGLAAAFTLFRNDFKNKIFSQCVSGCSGSSGAVYEWANIGEVTLQGVETSLTWPLARNLRLVGNYTYTDSERKSDDELAFDGTSLKGKPLDRTPRHVLNLKTEWQPMEKLMVFAGMNVQSEQYWANFRNGSTTTRRRPGATTYDLGASYVVNKNMTVRLSMLNITDKRVPVDYRARTAGLDGNWMVDEGRRLWLSTSISF